MSCEVLIAIIGIGLSSTMAAIGLFLNWKALRQSNRIAVSSKLAEASKLLSDELLAQVRSWKAFDTELKVAEKNMGSENTPEAENKIESLKLSIKSSLERQSEIDKETAVIDSMFSQTNSLNPREIDAIISRSYRLKAKAVSKLQYILDVQNGKA